MTRIDQIIKKWIETYPIKADLNSLLNYYKEKYKDVEIEDYSISENSIHIIPKNNVESLKISFKIG